MRDIGKFPIMACMRRRTMSSETSRVMNRACMPRRAAFAAKLIIMLVFPTPDPARMHPTSPSSMPILVRMSIGQTPVPKRFVCSVLRRMTRFLADVALPSRAPPVMASIPSLIFATSSICSREVMRLPGMAPSRTSERYALSLSLK